MSDLMSDKATSNIRRRQKNFCCKIEYIRSHYGQMRRDEWYERSFTVHWHRTASTAWRRTDRSSRRSARWFCTTRATTCRSATPSSRIPTPLSVAPTDRPVAYTGHQIYELRGHIFFCNAPASIVVRVKQRSDICSSVCLFHLSSSAAADVTCRCYNIGVAWLSFFTARCTIAQSAVLRSHVVCLWRWWIMTT